MKSHRSPIERLHMPETSDVTAHGSESENPAIDSPTPGGAEPAHQQGWWPNQLDLSVLDKHSPRATPLSDDFDYAAAFSGLDVDALKSDIEEVMTTSQDWWPADFGHYGPLFIRLSWHQRAPTGSRTGVAAPATAPSASPRSTAGPTTPTWTRPADSCGRSRRSTASRSPGPTCSCWRATSHWSRWGSRPSASPSVAPTSGSPRSCTGVRRTPGSVTSATAASASSGRTSVRSRWASSTSTPRARTATPTRSSRRTTSARPSPGWP